MRGTSPCSPSNPPLILKLLIWTIKYSRIHPWPIRRHSVKKALRNITPRSAPLYTEHLSAGHLQHSSCISGSGNNVDKETERLWEPEDQEVKSERMPPRMATWDQKDGSINGPDDVEGGKFLGESYPRQRPAGCYWQLREELAIPGMSPRVGCPIQNGQLWNHMHNTTNVTSRLYVYMFIHIHTHKQMWPVGCM